MCDLNLSSSARTSSSGLYIKSIIRHICTKTITLSSKGMYCFHNLNHYLIFEYILGFIKPYIIKAILWYFLLLYYHTKNYKFLNILMLQSRNMLITCSVPPPPVLSQSSDTLTIVHGSDAFQWKSTTLSLHSFNRSQQLSMEALVRKRKVLVHRIN